MTNREENLKGVFDRFNFRVSSKTKFTIEQLKKCCGENGTMKDINLDSLNLDPEKIYYIDTKIGGRGKPNTNTIKEFELDFFKQFVNADTTEEIQDKFYKQSRQMFCLKENWFLF